MTFKVVFGDKDVEKQEHNGQDRENIQDYKITYDWMFLTVVLGFLAVLYILTSLVSAENFAPVIFSYNNSGFTDAYIPVWDSQGNLFAEEYFPSLTSRKDVVFVITNFTEENTQYNGNYTFSIQVKDNITEDWVWIDELNYTLGWFGRGAIFPTVKAPNGVKIGYPDTNASSYIVLGYNGTYPNCLTIKNYQTNETIMDISCGGVIQSFGGAAQLRYLTTGLVAPNQYGNYAFEIAYNSLVPPFGVMRIYNNDTGVDYVVIDTVGTVSTLGRLVSDDGVGHAVWLDNGVYETSTISGVWETNGGNNNIIAGYDYANNHYSYGAGDLEVDNSINAILVGSSDNDGYSGDKLQVFGNANIEGNNLNNVHCINGGWSGFSICDLEGVSISGSIPFQYGGYDICTTSGNCGTSLQCGDVPGCEIDPGFSSWLGSGIISGMYDVKDPNDSSESIRIPDRYLANSAEVAVLNWQNQQLIDTSTYPSLSWSSRYLVGTDGMTTKLDWSQTGYTSVTDRLLVNGATDDSSSGLIVGGTAKADYFQPVTVYNSADGTAGATDTSSWSICTSWTTGYLCDDNWCSCSLGGTCAAGNICASYCTLQVKDGLVVGCV